MSQKSISSWIKTPIYTIANLVKGVTYQKDQASKQPFSDSISLLRATNIQNYYLNFDDLVYVPSDKVKDEQILRKNDIIFAMSSGSKHLVGKSAKYNSDINITFGAFCSALRVSELLEPAFFAYFFQTKEFRLGISLISKGSNINNLKNEHILDYEIYLPPLNEQKRIVQKIEELFSEIDDGIRSLETAKKQLDVYRHAILTAAFNGELTDKWRKKNPQLLLTTENLLNQLKDERKEHFEKQLKNWENEIKVWAKNDSDSKKPRKPKSPSLDIKYYKNEKLGVSIPLYELHLQVFDGPFGSNLKTADYTESGIPVVRLENIQFLEFITDKQAFISHEKYEILKKHTVKPNDIIFSSFIGEQNRVALIPPSIPKAINKADCFCIRNLSKLIEEKFILYFLASRDAYKQIEDEVHGVGRQRINTTQLKNIYLPIVSIDEQREIIAIIEKAFESYSNLLPIIDSELKRLSNLKVSILQKAFSGQLVPQDPNDEPASVLLERIKAEKEEELAKAKANKTPKKPTKRKTKATKEDEPAQQELI